MTFEQGDEKHGEEANEAANDLQNGHKAALLHDLHLGHDVSDGKVKECTKISAEKG